MILGERVETVIYEGPIEDDVLAAPLEVVEDAPVA